MNLKNISLIFRSVSNLFICALILFVVGVACISIDDENHKVISSGNYQYSLDDPDKSYDLPGSLEEISGLDYLSDQILLCIEDEKGILYFYNTIERKVTREIKFAKDGDYEGVTHIDNMAYVVKSNGDLFSFPIDGENKVDSRKIDTPFKGANDLEGLSVGHQDNELYFACKGQAEIENNQAKGRAVYRFDLKKNQLLNTPYILLTTELFKKALEQNDLSPSHHMPFKPSGIAIHPVTGDVFIIGSVGKLIIIINKSGSITGAAPLSKKIFVQPEGICFDEKGTLFISSEGSGKNGYILAFNPKI